MQRLLLILSMMTLSMLSACGGKLSEAKSRRNGDIDSVLEPGSRWESIGRGFQLTADSAVDQSGVVYFTDAQTNRILKADLAGKISVWMANSGGAHGIAMGADGRLYAGQHDRKRIVAFSPDDRKETVIAEGVQTHHLIVTAGNRVYFSEAPKHQVGVIDSDGTYRVATNEVDWPHGLHVITGKARLIVTDSMRGDVWSFEMQTDGALSNRMPFCRLESAGSRSEIEPAGVTSDTAGYVYIATDLGIQICDANGSVREVIFPPVDGGLSNVYFAGSDLRWLYTTDGNRLFRLHLKREGTR